MVREKGRTIRKKRKNHREGREGQKGTEDPRKNGKILEKGRKALEKGKMKKLGRSRPVRNSGKIVWYCIMLMVEEVTYY